MSTAAIFNQLGQSVMPQALAFALPDTMTIKAVNQVTDGAGGYTQGTPTDAYTAIPCAYEPKGGARFNSADQLMSVNLYTVTLPTHYNNAGTMTRINLNPTIHRFVVNVRGNEPTKTFRIISVADDLGAIFEATCEREN